MFRKILIANRGEIAVRIIRACKEMGVKSVAVFSTADRDSLHVRLADEAFCIGDPPPADSYLRTEAYLEVAAKTGADAVHPGYGFLSENADFAAACREAGIAFIGPSPESIRAMGDKLEARRGAEQYGVPVIPGTLGESLDARSAAKAAGEIGFPVMLKAVGGGGGKGMRAVASADEIESAFKTAASEAGKAFGNSEVYLERMLTSARHIEVQIARDRHGTGIHLFERECSVQRRHQKLIEEAPGAISQEMRDRMTEAALRIADGIDYVTVGTVEFLVEGDEFYFLEMNTRLQVEHPVTEFITGVDLVRLQIRIAAGEPIDVAQSDLSVHGHAVEARICAEDPAAGFRPSIGRISDLHLPGGPGVRIDTDLAIGREVTLFYDPLVAKLVVHAPDRDQALDRMRLALDELGVGGIRTTGPLLARVVMDPEFRAGGYDTSYLGRFLERSGTADPDGVYAADDSKSDDENEHGRLAAAIAAVLSAAAQRQRRAVAPAMSSADGDAESPWILDGRVQQMRGSR